MDYENCITFFALWNYFHRGIFLQATERKLITPNTANSTEKSQVSTDSITSIPTFTLKGQVTDVYGQPIPHAYVLYDDEKSGGIVTDNYGHFSIQVYAYQRILFKHGSYVPQTIVAQPGDSPVQIKMYPEAYHLKDAVITAVSQNKKIQYGETELGVCGERENFRLILEFLSEQFSDCHIPFTAVYEAAKEYCGL